MKTLVQAVEIKFYEDTENIISATEHVFGGMSSLSKNSIKWRKAFRHNRQNHPCHFYGDHPNLGVAVYYYRDVPYSRALVYRSDPKGPWEHYGQMIGNDKDVFSAMLNTSSITDDDSNWIATEAFKYSPLTGSAKSSNKVFLFPSFSCLPIIYCLYCRSSQALILWNTEEDKPPYAKKYVKVSGQSSQSCMLNSARCEVLQDGYYENGHYQPSITP